MPNSDLLPSLLFKINQNQLALEAAIMELTLWVEQRGSSDVAENVRGALGAISARVSAARIAFERFDVQWNRLTLTSRLDQNYAITKNSSLHLSIGFI